MKNIDDDGAEVAALELRSVSKTFGRAVALTDVSFTVRKGSIHGLCGENGAGKSTLVKILNGQYPAGTYEGEVLVDGSLVALTSSSDALAKGIGVVPQETSVIGTMTVAENIALRGLPRWRAVRKRKLNQDVGVFLASIGIDLAPAQLVDELSTSSKQLLMIARALYDQPSVLLLDEPTTALTDSEMGNLHRVIRELSARGITIVLITHKLEEIFELCDRVSVLRDGALVDIIPAEELSSERLVGSMTGRDIADLYPRNHAPHGEEIRLSVENITVPHSTIPGRNVVDGVSFELRRGEVIGIGGPLGSGRSELLLAIYGATRRRGRVTLNGQELASNKPAMAVDRGLAIVPEDRKTEGLLFNMRIDDNMTLSALRAVSTGAFVSRRRQGKTTKQFIDEFGIAGARAAAGPGSLSGGNQQKLLLSRAIVPAPTVVLLDEPTKGVDVGAKADIYRSIARLASEGVSVVIVSSELPELLGNCDRILMMQKGRIVSEYHAEHTTREQLLEASMTGSVAARHDNTALEATR